MTTSPQVEFKERAYAYGRVPARGDRRDAVGTDREVLAARAVDRALRPLFPPGYNCTVQVRGRARPADYARRTEDLCVRQLKALLFVSSARVPTSFNTLPLTPRSPLARGPPNPPTPKTPLPSPQLFNLLLSSDGALDPEVLAINAASAALLRAGLPWGGPVG